MLAWRRLPPEQRKEMVKRMEGFKTYLAAAATVITAWAAFAKGSIDLASAFQATITAVLAATVRHGVTTEAGKAK
jgi:hypothetical protein